VTAHVIPRLSPEKPMVGGPSHALNPVWDHALNGGATIRCMCGHLVTLGRYSIDERGVVSPEFDCPTSTCAWSGALQLEGWAS
jgi:hypothetical protein